MIVEDDSSTSRPQNSTEGKGKATFKLQCDDHGCPIIPDPSSMEGPALAAAVREVMTHHYRK